MIYEQGSVTKGAGALGMSQPAMTAQLRRIEALLGGEVFSRGRQGAIPTPFGEFVLSRARAAVSSVDDLLDAKPRDPAVLLRIGGFSTGLPVIELIDEISALMPGLEISVHTEFSVRLLLDMVASRRLDCALIADNPGRRIPTLPRIVHEEIGHNPIFVALPCGHPAAAKADVPLTELADSPWVIAPPDGIGWPEHFFDVCEKHAVSPNIAHQMTEVNLRAQLIATGRAITACQPNFPAGPGVAVRALAGDPMWIRYLFLWHDASPVAPHGPELARFARQALAESMTRSPAYADWVRRRRGQGGVPTGP